MTPEEEREKILPLLKTEQGRQKLIDSDKTGLGILLKNDVFYEKFLQNLFKDDTIKLHGFKFIEKGKGNGKKA